MHEGWHEEDITILNVYTSTNRAPKYIKQNLIKLKEEINNAIFIYLFFQMQYLKEGFRGHLGGSVHGNSDSWFWVRLWFHRSWDWVTHWDLHSAGSLFEDSLFPPLPPLTHMQSFSLSKIDEYIFKRESERFQRYLGSSID